MSGIILFKHVFGAKPNQTIAEFAAECRPLTTDWPFVKEVLAFGIEKGLVPADTRIDGMPV